MAQRHPRPSSSRLGGAAGYTLVEVIVAMLISCVMVTAVMGVAITAKQSTGENMRRLQADQGIAQLSGQLKGYVTACGCNPQTGSCPAPACTTILGPNTANAGAATWYLNSDNPAQNSIRDSVGDKYALMCGNHVITGLVPAIEAAPYNGGIRYSVWWPPGAPNCPALPGPTGAPIVTFSANWTEP